MPQSAEEVPTMAAHRQRLEESLLNHSSCPHDPTVKGANRTNTKLLDANTCISIVIIVITLSFSPGQIVKCLSLSANPPP